MQSTDSIFPLLINMAGGVCLLLWGSYTVRASVERAFASQLNQLVSRASSAPLTAVIAGVVAAILMQSATATVLLGTALVGAGTLSLGAAMALVLGADLGSAIAARILFIDLSLLPPLLLIAGIVLHLLSTTWKKQYFGRILIGLGLMLLAILWIKQLIAPLADSPLPEDWMSVLTSVPWLALVVVALATWFAHSSVAVVLVIATLDQSGLLPLSLLLPMLLGANVGAGLIALPMVGGRETGARAVVICNLGVRVLLALLASVMLPWLLQNAALLSASPGTRIVLCHIAFNLLLVVLFIAVADRLVNRLHRWLQRRAESHDSMAVNEAGAGLDPALVTKPRQALASARREAFRLGDITENLFANVLDMFAAKDQSQIHNQVATDHEINIRNKAILRYLSEVRHHVKSPEQEVELDQVLHFASTMENIGDTVSHNISRLALKRLDRGVMFSTAGFDEIKVIHQEVLKLLRDEINRFAAGIIGNPKKTRKSVEQIRSLCTGSVSQHRIRLSDNKTRSIGSSSIHQDTVRDLLQIALLLEHSPG
ncbi:MAG: Na/Pi cotransporter family protein [bacterium]